MMLEGWDWLYYVQLLGSNDMISYYYYRMLYGLELFFVSICLSGNRGLVKIVLAAAQFVADDMGVG